MTPFQPSDPNGLRLGERLTLTCSVTKGDLPLFMSWTVDGRPVGREPGAPSSPKTVQIDAYTSLLVVDSLQARHSGNYSCLVRNPAAEARQQQSQLVLIQGTRSRNRTSRTARHFSVERAHDTLDLDLTLLVRTW